MCTAFVVDSRPRQTLGRYGENEVRYEQLLVSAGHCATVGDEFRFETKAYRHRYEFGGKEYGFWVGAGTAYAQLVGFSSGPRGYDVGVWRFWTHVPYPTLQVKRRYVAIPGELLLVIGYPSKVLQAYIAPFVRYESDGVLSIGRVGQKGMSGSPVLNKEGKVVGVAVAMKVKNPYACFLGVCERLPEYYAEPIDRVFGIVKLEDR